jgi:indole-3-glycerol phosphate synthase
MGFLSDVTSAIRHRLEARPLDDVALMARAASLPPPRDLVRALAADGVAVIAEVKRASPSAGSIDDEADPVATARAYVAGGAAAISVLTEPLHFHGSLLDLHAVRSAVDVPVMRKDFLIDPSQVIEARAHGADAVLLIAACLGGAELEAMLAVAGDLGMGSIVEAHADEDLDRALATGAAVIGVNARDLETLEVDVERALELLRRIPHGRLCVMESGISERSDVERAAAAGASAILVGEALMRARDPIEKLRELRGEEMSR